MQCNTDHTPHALIKRCMTLPAFSVIDSKAMLLTHLSGDTLLYALRALSVHYGGAVLLILLLGDPHLLEGGEGGDDGTPDPHGVLPLRGLHHRHTHRRRSQGQQLLLQTSAKPCRTNQTRRMGRFRVKEITA